MPNLTPTGIHHYLGAGGALLEIGKEYGTNLEVKRAVSLKRELSGFNAIVTGVVLG